MSVNIYQTTWYDIPEDSALHIANMFYKNSTALQMTRTLKGYSNEILIIKADPCKCDIMTCFDPLMSMDVHELWIRCTYIYVRFVLGH
jgi:hypothetical protein